MSWIGSIRRETRFPAHPSFREVAAGIEKGSRYLTMASKRRIRSKDIVPDILSGMSDAQLMKKYKLSPKGLRSAFTKLLKKGCLEVGDLYHRVPSRGSETIVIDQLAHLPQNHLTLNVPIEDLTQPGVTGTLWYVTDRNFAVTGIQARHGEKRSFSVPCREYLRAQAITFEAECLWTSKKSATDPSVTAFRITKISTVDLAHLRELIQVATLTIG